MSTRRIGILARVWLGLAVLSTMVLGVSRPASAFAPIIYVKASATGLKNGTSWTNAYKSLQPALAAASGGGYQIWVAAGTYKPTNGNSRSISFDLPDNTSIYGGFKGNETLVSQRQPGKFVSILSGDIGAAGAAGDNSLHVVTASGIATGTTLDGFTIKGGNASGNALAGSGGGLLADGAGALTIRNVVFSGNNAKKGGGLYHNSSNTSVRNVTFTANHASSAGGAAYDYLSGPLYENVTFQGNSSDNNGGGLYSTGSAPILRNTTFSGNSAANHGGAIYDTGGGGPTIVDSIIWANGPGAVYSSAATPNITFTLISGGCPAGATCTTHVGAADPVLGPLQKNGGFVSTMALGAGSAAIDAGDDGSCAVADARGVSRPQPADQHCDRGAYEVKALEYFSNASQDGEIKESSENSGVGGSINSTSNLLRVGDDNSNRQLVGVLSFPTGGVPDGATVVAAKILIYDVGFVGINPFGTHGKMLIDVAKPYFGVGSGLAKTDFEAPATVTAGGVVPAAMSNFWHTGILNTAGLTAVNKQGLTQLRLRFAKDDNNDHTEDYVSLETSDASSFNVWPYMIVYYNP